MDSKEPIAESSTFPFDVTRSMLSVVEEAWQVPRLLFVCWWNVIFDSYWLQRELDRPK